MIAAIEPRGAEIRGVRYADIHVQTHVDVVYRTGLEPHA
jgi:hypothetical protein